MQKYLTEDQWSKIFLSILIQLSDPPKQVRIPTSERSENIDISPELNIDFKENSLFQEGVILETFQRPDKSFFQEPQDLEGLVNLAR